MSRSPCAASLKNILPIKELKSPNFRFEQCKVHHLSPARNQLNRSNFNSNLLSVDSPNRLLFISKIKTKVNVSNVLGRGRFGHVVLAKYKGNDVAVKIIKDISQRQLMNEINAEALSHANIIPILKIEQIDADVVVLMEPWGSLNLQQLLSVSRQICRADIISYSKQLASALDCCHSNGILHLDVKPANIMVNIIDNQGWIKLGDFGNSVTLNQLESGACEQKVGRVGTVAYCAPEILKGEEPSQHSDVYSYGITLWQIENNRNPFSDLSWPTIAYLVVAKNERPPLRETAITEETRLADLYQRCWSPSREDRPYMTEVMKILDGF